MTGNFIDTIRFSSRKISADWGSDIALVSTDFGKVRILDTKGDKPVVMYVPDGPNVIEHYEKLFAKLSDKFRVICFELPGIGFSYPNSKYDYSIKKSAELTVNVMDLMKVERATLCFSCSNGFYAIKTAEMFPERVAQLFLSQTPSLDSMNEWTKSNIPSPLKYPLVGQIINAFAEKKLAKRWYKKALPKATNKAEYEDKALDSIDKGGCFCLSSLVQGLTQDLNIQLKVTKVPSTLIWGNKDHSHRKTDSNSISKHLPDCEIIEFENCGHFPELENTDEYVKLLSKRLER